MIDLWRTSLQRVQERFQAVAVRGNPLRLCLIQTASPCESDFPGLPPIASRDRIDATRGGALSRNPIARGIPGEAAFEMRPGFQRIHYYHSDTVGFFGEYEPLASAAGACHSGFPAPVRNYIWQDVAGSKLSTEAHCDLWTDAIFELAWRRAPGSPLRATDKAAWRDNVSMSLDAIGRFDDMLPDDMPRFTNPPDRWFSIIEDGFGASVAAIDLLLAIPEQSTDPEPIPSATSPSLEGDWSAPMTKADMARRITGRRKARAREVESYLSGHGIKNVGGNKWIVRLDTMDANNRKKLEAGT